MVNSFACDRIFCPDCGRRVAHSCDTRDLPQGLTQREREDILQQVQPKRPAGWPDDLPLPTEEDAEQGRIEGERVLRELQEARRGKIIAGGDQEMTRTRTTI